MAFQIPQPGARLKKNQFEFQLPTAPGTKPTSEKFSLPKLEFLPDEGEAYLEKVANVAIQHREYVLGLVEAVNPEVGQKMREARMARDQVHAFYDAWLASSKVTEGESSASDDM